MTRLSILDDYLALFVYAIHVSGRASGARYRFSLYFLILEVILRCGNGKTICKNNIGTPSLIIIEEFPLIENKETFSREATIENSYYGFRSSIGLRLCGSYGPVRSAR
jgi:hypothetical protein